MDILIPEYKIERRIRAMAHKISEEHRASGDVLPPVMICVLNGAFMFFNDEPPYFWTTVLFDVEDMIILLV